MTIMNHLCPFTYREQYRLMCLIEVGFSISNVPIDCSPLFTSCDIHLNNIRKFEASYSQIRSVLRTVIHGQSVSQTPEA
jgi:hypothetical protein